jgi:hypothetical protein
MLYSHFAIVYRTETILEHYADLQHRVHPAHERMEESYREYWNG